MDIRKHDFENQSAKLLLHKDLRSSGDHGVDAAHAIKMLNATKEKKLHADRHLKRF